MPGKSVWEFNFFGGPGVFGNKTNNCRALHIYQGQGCLGMGMLLDWNVNCSANNGLTKVDKGRQCINNILNNGPDNTRQ